MGDVDLAGSFNVKLDSNRNERYRNTIPAGIQ